MSKFLYLQPQYFSARNNISSANYIKKNLFSYFFTIALAFFILSIGYGSLVTIRQQSNQEIEIVGIMNSIFHYYFYIITIAGTLTAITSLYQDKSLDFYLSKPLKIIPFAFAKFCEVSLSVAWFGLIMAIPSLLIFGLFLEAHLFYYLYGFISILFLHFLGSLFAGLFALALGPLFTPGLGKKIIITIGAIWILFFLFKIIVLSNDSSVKQNLFTKLNADNLSFYIPLKLFWIELNNLNLFRLLNFQNLSISASIKFFGTFAFIFIFSISIFKDLYLKLLEVTRNQNGYNKTSVKNNKKHLRLFNGLLQTFWTKEIKTFERESINSVQLSILVIVFIFYIFSLSQIAEFENMPLLFQIWIKSLLLLVNYMSVMMIAAILCARFVFTSISLEGKSFWMIESAPILLKKYLFCKKMIWFFLISLIVTPGILISSQIISPSPSQYIILALCVLVNLYGLTSLAIGLGSYYCRLDWEHISQLTSSFGNFFYLICSFILILTNLIPVGFIITLTTLLETNAQIPILNISIYYISFFIIMAYLNLIFARISVKKGLLRISTGSFIR